RIHRWAVSAKSIATIIRWSIWRIRRLRPGLISTGFISEIFIYIHLEFVGLLRQTIRQIDGHLGRLVLVQLVTADEFRQEGAVDPPGHVVPSRDREEGPR